jgi:hypothetical protein
MMPCRCGRVKGVWSGVRDGQELRSQIPEAGAGNHEGCSLPERSLNMSDTFDHERTIIDYRNAIVLRDAQCTALEKAEFEARAQRLRQAWKEWQGDDSLHEMAFGEPQK